MRNLNRLTWPLLLCAALPCLLSGQAAPRLRRAIDNAQRFELRGNVRREARPEFDRGPAPASLPMRRMLLLLKRAPAQETALQQLLVDQQTSGSANYHHWLTPAEFGARFGPSLSDIAKVTAWLASQGFAVDHVAPGRNVIEFSGTAATVAAAFQTQMHRYEVGGVAHWANASNPTLPQALTPVVAGVVSLNNFVKPSGRERGRGTAEVAAPGELQPSFNFTDNQGQSAHALVPADFAILYNVAPLYQAGINGSGQTIAVVGRSDVNMQDVSDFRNRFDVTPVTNLPTVIVNGPDPGDIGGADEGESDLDLQWAGAVAPNATIDFVVSATTDTTDGIDLSAEYIVDNDLAPVMSTSYAGCEAALGTTENQFISTLYEQAAAQGITVIDSSGDSGAAGCDPNDGSETAASQGLGVSGLASTPFNVAVGGTEFNEGSGTYWNATNDPTTSASALGPIPEEAWNESCLNQGCDPTLPFSASGGGASGIYGRPAWQNAAGNFDPNGARDVPDIAFSAAGHDGYVVCQGGSCQIQNNGGGKPLFNFLVFGGTSASTPSFAGVMALVNQKTASIQGQANYELYSLARNKENWSTCNSATGTKTSMASCIFLDTTVGNNSVPCTAGSPNCSGTQVNGNNVLPGFSAGTGYDMATGLGSINVANLVNNWSSAVAAIGTSTTLQISPTTAQHGAGVTLTVNVTPSAATAKVMSGDVSLIAEFPNGSQQGVDFGTVSTTGCGSANEVCISGSESGFPGGTYNVVARYAGDGNFAPSLSNPVQITISPEASVTTVSAFEVNTQFEEVPITNALYGDLIYLDGSVFGAAAVANANACAANPANCINDGVPSGTVAFSNNGSALAIPAPGGGTLPSTLALNTEGAANYPGGVTTLPPGTYSITGAYSGDASFNPSSSSSIALVIAPSPTKTTVTSQPAGNNQLALTATIDTNGSLGLPPTGTVTFLSGGASLGTANVIGSNDASTGVATGTATLTVATPAGGASSITTFYSGDSNYSGTTPYTLAVSPASANATVGGSPASYNITLTPVTSFTGNVTLSCGGLPSLATCTFTPPTVALSGTAAGTASLSISVPAGGGEIPGGPGNPAGPWPWLLLAGLAALPLALLRRLRRLALPGALALLALGAAGCGGGGGNNNGGNGTPNPVSFSITISATSGNHTASQSVTLVEN